ncbi:MAG: hypothetical protein ACTS5I_14715, partial [Rhodanobacter sp.]
MVVLMVAFTPAASAAACVAAMQPLQFGNNVVNLPAGRADRPYRYLLHATGGTPPYIFHAKDLPAGLTLSLNGMLARDPGRLPLIAVFPASVRDANGCTVEKRLRVAIMPVRPPKQRPLAPPSVDPAPSTQLPHRQAPSAQTPEPAPVSAIAHADILAEPVSLQPNMDTYTLTAAVYDDEEVLDELKQMFLDNEPYLDATPSADPDDSRPALAPAADVTANDDQLDADTKAQFKRLVDPLIGVEYPGRDLFEAALDTRLCRFSAALIATAATKQGQVLAPTNQASCPPPWDELPSSPDPRLGGPVLLKDVPRMLMSAHLRELLIEKARQNHLLRNPKPLHWDGAGCGCVLDLSGEVYGFHPFWRTGEKPKSLDFSLLSRISLFALWYQKDGDLVLPAWSKPQDTAFILEAHRHRTQLDYTIYRNNWQFLTKISDDHMTSVAARLAKQSADFIDTPLTGFVARSHAWVPGFSTVERMGDGLTFFPDQVPAADSPLREPYERYQDRQIRALITSLLHRDRPYVLNIVLRDSGLREGGVWEVGKM